jgi:hypothetical protein
VQQERVQGLPPWLRGEGASARGAVVTLSKSCRPGEGRGRRGAGPRPRGARPRGRRGRGRRRQRGEVDSTRNCRAGAGMREGKGVGDSGSLWESRRGSLGFHRVQAGPLGTCTWAGFRFEPWLVSARERLASRLDKRPSQNLSLARLYFSTSRATTELSRASYRATSFLSSLSSNHTTNAPYSHGRKHISRERNLACMEC